MLVLCCPIYATLLPTSELIRKYPPHSYLPRFTQLKGGVYLQAPISTLVSHCVPTPELIRKPPSSHLSCHPPTVIVITHTALHASWAPNQTQPRGNYAHVHMICTMPSTEEARSQDFMHHGIHTSETAPRCTVQGEPTTCLWLAHPTISTARFLLYAQALKALGSLHMLPPLDWSVPILSHLNQVYDRDMHLLMYPQ